MSEAPGNDGQELENALLFYAEKHPEQRETAARMLHFLHTHADAFKRSCQPGHFTGSAWLINPAGDKVLLTLHRKLQRWLQTGGHADGEPDTLRVALREAEEESGIRGIKPVSPEIFDIDIHLIPENTTKGEPAHYHYDVRYLLRTPHENVVISDESDALRWCSKEDFTFRRDELDTSIHRMAERYFGR
jgi:8-oxo-dGTP pyrophosphatase MutT (NUDIX family)